MKDITVVKDELVKALEANRAEHRELFLKAQEAYRAAVINALDAELKSAREGRPFELARIVMLQAPTDHTDDYDRVIQMLKMEVRPQVELSEQEFRCYVQDSWGWMHQFANNVTSYGVTNAKMSRYRNE